MTFSDMATKFLKEQGYEVVECGSEHDAIELSENLRNGSKEYPVYYFGSDTTGEKPCEEFYTENETIEMERYGALGVVTDITPRPIFEIDTLFEDMNNLFNDAETKKADIVTLMKRFLKNFDHVEKGKNLDSKM